MTTSQSRCSDMHEPSDQGRWAARLPERPSAEAPVPVRAAVASASDLAQRPQRRHTLHHSHSTGPSLLRAPRPRRPNQRQVVPVFERSATPKQSRRQHRRWSTQVTDPERRQSLSRSASERPAQRKPSALRRQRSSNAGAVIVPYLARRGSALAMDLSAELKLVKRNVLSLKPWLDAFGIMRIVVLNVTVGTVAGWATAALFTVALTDSRTRFLVSTATTYVALTSLGFLWLFALVAAKAMQHAPPRESNALPVTEQRRGSIRAVSLHLVWTTAPVLLACLGFAPLSMQLLVWADARSICQRARVHVYLVVSVSGLFVYFAGAKVLRLLQQQQQKRAKPRKRNTFVGFALSLVYLHVSTFVTLSKHWHALAFACGSFGLKVAMQEAVKTFQLRGRDAAHATPSPLTVHIAMTVPTVAIDMQIRMVFLRVSAAQSSSVVTASAAVVCCEVVFRLAKIARLRHAITARLVQCKRASEASYRDHAPLTVARAEYTAFMDWKAHALRLHAAEVFADMHGEYLSAGCSMAVVFFLHRHAMYDSRLVLGTEDLGSMGLTAQLAAAGVQVVSGLLSDWVLSLIETVHEVPLYEAICDDSRRNSSGAPDRRTTGALLPFLQSLLAVLATMNVGVIALFSAKVAE